MSEVNIRPQDFYSDAPPERIMGSECEYMVPNQLEKNGKMSNIIENLLRPGTINGAVGHRLARPHNGTRLFLLNGACAYKDLSHLEYCTPEARRPGELVAADLAGSLIVGALARAYSSEDIAIYRRVSTRHQQDTGTTSGYHENYMVGAESEDGSILSPLIDAHTATNVWGWSGIVDTSYELSQKAIGVGVSLSDTPAGSLTQHGQKPIARIVREADTTPSDSGWSRLEIRACDAPFSPWAIYMKYATTSLVMLLAAHPQFIEKSLRTATLRDPIATLQQTSQDLSMSQTNQLTDGTAMRAVDIQRSLATSAQLMSEHIQIHESLEAAIPEWLAACDDLDKMSGQTTDHDFTLLADRVEWAARHTILAKKLGHAAITRQRQDTVMLDLIWDRVYPTGIATKYWSGQENAFSAHGSLDAQMHFAAAPPVDTRAAARAALLASDDHFLSVTWSKLSSPNKTYLLKDAYSNRLPNAA